MVRPFRVQLKGSLGVVSLCGEDARGPRAGEINRLVRRSEAKECKLIPLWNRREKKCEQPARQLAEWLRKFDPGQIHIAGLLLSLYLSLDRRHAYRY